MWLLLRYISEVFGRIYKEIDDLMSGTLLNQQVRGFIPSFVDHTKLSDTSVLRLNCFREMQPSERTKSRFAEPKQRKAAVIGCFHVKQRTCSVPSVDSSRPETCQQTPGGGFTELRAAARLYSALNRLWSWLKEEAGNRSEQRPVHPPDVTWCHMTVVLSIAGGGLCHFNMKLPPSF